MFKCDFCNKDSKLNEKMHRQVTKIRGAQYANESFGTEIVQEKKACGACYLAASEVEPEMVDGGYDEYR